MDKTLTEPECQRYSRQMVLPELGTAGQLRLKNASALLVGSGALGSPAALYLAAAGVGTLVIVDGDTVEISNLHRQVLHRTSTLGQAKSESALQLLRDLNPEISIVIHHTRLTPDNAPSLAHGCDVIVDGCDNFPTRFLTNDTGFFLGIPVVHGAIDRFQGQVSVFAPHSNGPCYRCLLPNMPPPGSVPTCQEAGVIGALPGIIGSMMAMETIKLILQIGDSLIGRLLLYDALAGSTRTLRLRPDPSCALCGDNPSIHTLDNPETNASPTCDTAADWITADELQSLWKDGYEGIILDVREPAEHATRQITGSRLIPLGQLAARIAELPREQDIILHCKMGGRSAKALAYLKSQGYTRVRHLQGGIDAWPA
jgi:molybdopterin/thiamine biosynthesis adenylyltransferase/rhodanese-related sulfurtransferase